MVNAKIFMLISVSLIPIYVSHSAMMDPENTSPFTCRMGGDPRFGVDNCRGPCDLRAIRSGRANHASPDNPAATYSRGQTVTVKYQRNNHGPGGFIRMSLVRANDMMNVSKHNENTFHYTCWGGNPVVATPEEKVEDQYRYSLVGNDGKQHSFPVGYYAIEVTIPSIVPDGDYVLRMIWHGGMRGSVRGNTPQPPDTLGYFADYHSCSFVKIEGGEPLASSFQPNFINDMEQFSKQGCMSANDRPGVCVYEPCLTRGKFQKPAEFKDRKYPSALTPANFGGQPPISGSSPPPSPSPSSSPMQQTERDWSVRQMRLSCLCMRRGKYCSPSLATKTAGHCKSDMWARFQGEECKNACSDFCTLKQRRFCKRRILRPICGL